MDSQSEADPTSLELLYVAIHANESCKAGLNEDNSFSDSECRIQFVFNKWVKMHCPSEHQCFREHLQGSLLKPATSAGQALATADLLVPPPTSPSPPVTTTPLMSCKKVSASSRANEILRGVLGGSLPADQAAEPQSKGKKRTMMSSSTAYNKLSHARRDEIHAMTSKFVSDMKEYASRNNLNPADVM